MPWQTCSTLSAGTLSATGMIKCAPRINAGGKIIIVLRRSMPAIIARLRRGTRDGDAAPLYRGSTSDEPPRYVASIPACVTPVRAMIDAYDHYYGGGTGAAFFTGPYLDVLPKAVVEAGRKSAQSSRRRFPSKLSTKSSRVIGFMLHRFPATAAITGDR